MDNLGYEDSDAEYNYDSDNSQSSNERIHDIEQLVLNPYRYGFFLCVIYEYYTLQTTFVGMIQ